MNIQTSSQEAFILKILYCLITYTIILIFFVKYIKIIVNDYLVVFSEMSDFKTKSRNMILNNFVY